MDIINKKNLKKCLQLLGFTESGDIFEKKFPTFNCSMSVDFAKETWYEVIEKTVPPKTVELNKKAFDAGYNM